MAVFAFFTIAKVLHTFPQGLKIPAKSDNSLHMCAHPVQEWCTAPCTVEVWRARVMGEVRLIDLFRALYVVYNVARCRTRVDGVCAHLMQFIWYLLDE